MKKTILKLGKFLTSRMLYLFVGIFISVAVLVAQAAWYNTQYDPGTDVNPDVTGYLATAGVSLTPELWNGLVVKVRENEVLTCTRETNPGGWQNPITNDGTVTYTASCPADYYGITCNFNFYDNNGALYNASIPATWNAARTQCSGAPNDLGISQGAMVVECCK